MFAACHRDYGWIGWLAKATVYIFLFLITLSLAANLLKPAAIDFISYWAAGALTLDGNPSASYVIDVHRGVELQVVEMEGFMPFPYPPPFLFLAAPLALLPFALAVICWVAITFAFYMFCVRRLAPTGAAIAAAYPPVLPNALVGQTGFLVTGLMAGGMALLARRPFLAGLLLGCLVLKPQFGLVLPFVLLAAREWRAIAGATASVLGLLLLGALVFGLSAYTAWIGQVPFYTAVVADGLSGWNKMASVYAAMRLAGASNFVALSLHFLVAAMAVTASCMVWRRTTDIGARAGSLSAATALASPYLYGYDTLVLALPFLWLATDPRARPALACVWAISVTGLLLNIGAGHHINPAPLAAMILLALVCRRVFERDRKRVSDAAPLGAAA
jgi:hypothetical protein